MKSIKNKALIITATVFFLIINTSYFWVDKIGIWGFFMCLPLIIIYFILVVFLIIQLCFAIKEKFKQKFRIFNIGILTVVVFLTFLFPTGIINFENFESKDLLIARRKGVASCSAIIKLKENLTFVEKEICFGVYEKKGTYHIFNDTIYFIKGKENLGYKFAVVQESQTYTKYPVLTLFKDKKDTIGYSYRIFKNELIPNQQTNIKK